VEAAQGGGLRPSKIGRGASHVTCKNFSFWFEGLRLRERDSRFGAGTPEEPRRKAWWGAEWASQLQGCSGVMVLLHDDKHASRQAMRHGLS
jgi:hypothetical protein